MPNCFDDARARAQAVPQSQQPKVSTSLKLVEGVDAREGEVMAKAASRYLSSLRAYRPRVATARGAVFVVMVGGPVDRFEDRVEGADVAPQRLARGAGCRSACAGPIAA